MKVVYNLFSFVILTELCMVGSGIAIENPTTRAAQQTSYKGGTVHAAVECSDNQMSYDGTCIDTPFQITTSNDNNVFVLKISAAGTFYIDWGDGWNEKTQLVKQNTSWHTINHHFSDKKGSHTIKIGGRATGYSTRVSDAAIRFNIDTKENDYERFSSDSNAGKIVAVSGELGAIFPTLVSSSTGQTQPKFVDTFRGASNLRNIPDSVFKGVYGAPSYNMFKFTFAGTNINSVPANVFSSINGKPSTGTFYGTFASCKNLTSVPSDLFSGIAGDADADVFNSTFLDCNNLSYFTDEKGNVSYVPASFLNTMSGDKKYSSIVKDMFKGTRLLDSCPSGTIDVTPESFNNAGKPWCEGSSGIEVPAGKYLPANTTTPQSCKSTGTFYCPGGSYSRKGVDQGIFSCPFNGRSNSDRTSCNITISKNQMKNGSLKDSVPCWQKTDSAEYKNCVFGGTIK